MSYVYDIKASLDGAIQDENSDRLLWFARIRNYMLQAESYDIRRSIELIINRFKEEGSKDPKIAHWLLNILQMCAVHCTDKFIVALNDHAVLCPFRKVLTDQSYSTQCDGAVRLKLFTLLKAWHEQYKEFFPESAFKKIYEDVYYGGEQSGLQPDNLHWFPDRTIVNEALDSIPYDLVRVGNELLSCGNKSFYHLNFLCAYPEHSSINRVQAAPQDLVNEASMTFMRMEADVRFWEDIVQHAKIPKESSQAIATIGDDLRKLKSDVEQIFQNLNNSGPSSSRSGDQSSDRQGSALSLEGADRGLDLQPTLPTTESLSSRPSEQGYGIHEEALSQASHDLRTGENRDSDLQFGRPVLDNYESRLTDQNSGPNITGSTVDHSVISQSQAGKANDTQQSSLVDHAGHIQQGDSSAAGFLDHTTNARDGQPKTEYDDVLSRYRSRLPGENTASKIKASAGNNSVVSRSQVNKAHDTSQPEDLQRANWMCPICRTGFQEKEEYIGHLSSREHKENVAKLPPLPTDDNELSNVYENRQSTEV